MDFNKYKDLLIKDAIRLINISSIYDENTRQIGKPFGNAINSCLNETLKICDELGFRTYKDFDGYYGYAEVGTGEDYIAILCHVDVVPAGDLKLWDFPPYEGRVINNELYGRGSGDDKGPTITAIYAVKAFVDSNIKFNKRVRLIFGPDEETLWRGMEVYTQKEKDPICAIAPDGKFPFSYAEKGLLEFELVRNTHSDDIIINGGENYNSVAMDASYSGPLAKEVAGLINGDIDFELDGQTINIIGIPAHASTPYLGKNAILYLAKKLKELGERNDIIELLTNFFNYNYQEAILFNEKIADDTGEITVNLGAIEMDKESTKIKIDIRIPVTFSKELIIKKIMENVSKYGFVIKEFSYLKPLYVPLESEFIKILYDTYQKCTNDYDSLPISSGGATYARVFSKNSVSFGATFKNAKSYAHEPNERVNVDNLIKALEIYYHTLIKLNYNEHID